MPELKVYEVEVNGWPTTLQLTDADAEARGLTAKDLVERRAAAGSAPAQTPTKRRTAANKARTAANKGA